ncbi:hypothetical protein C0991_002360, partial [Blastosporella zonata]
MPRIYVHAPPQPQPTMTDADDSIVLDDLVRTGEASRLRRRGAMRLDHTHTHTVHGQPSSFTMPSWAGDTGDSDDDEHEEVSQYTAHPGPVPPRTLTRTRAYRRHDEEQPEPPSYTIFCGGDEPISEYEPEVDSAPYTPSILPLPAPPRRKTPTKKRRTNGCGAVLHLSAVPRRRPTPPGFTWFAPPGTGADNHTLLPLDPSYFDESTRLRIQRSPCGCVREGIACAVCGNPLGTRYRPCVASAHAHSHVPTPSARPPNPSAVHYTRVASPCVSSYSYSFLPSAVTSSPVYTPPPPASSPDPTPSSNTYTYIDASSFLTEPQPQPPSYRPLLDRLITASPTPLSDEERLAYRARPAPAAQPRYSYGYGYGRPWGGGGYGTGGLYDADGEMITIDPAGGEPGSPKAGEMVLLPER